MYGSIDQKDLPLRDVVETWLMACSIRSNEEVTEKSVQKSTYMDVPARLDNMYCIRYTNMHITTLTGNQGHFSCITTFIRQSAARGPFLCDIMTFICERFWRGPVFTIGVLV